MNVFLYNLLFLTTIIELALAQMKPQPLDPVMAAGKAPKADEPVIIVGGGLAGMAAAIESSTSGRRQSRPCGQRSIFRREQCKGKQWNQRLRHKGAKETWNF